MPRDVSEFMRRVEELTPEEKGMLLACMQLISGEIPDDKLSVLKLNRCVIKAQMKGEQIPPGTMPMLAGYALQIIDGVADLADRRVLMSYYWHAEDVQSKKVPDVLKRNGFTPA